MFHIHLATFKLHIILCYGLHTIRVCVCLCILLYPIYSDNDIKTTISFYSISFSAWRFLSIFSFPFDTPFMEYIQCIHIILYWGDGIIAPLHINHQIFHFRLRPCWQFYCYLVDLTIITINSIHINLFSSYFCLLVCFTFTSIHFYTLNAIGSKFVA